MLHLLAPAGSSEAVIAAVQNGADMIYMEYGAVAGERSMSREDLSQSIRYCRVRGCGAAVTMDELLTDEQLPEAVKRAVYAAEQGAEVILVRDLGLIQALRRVLPEVALWGSVRMGIHNLDGALTAAALGLRRITLAPELELEQIQTIAAGVPVETAVCVHGPVCFSYSGQCYMSAMGDQGLSDSTLRCAEPCRERLTLGGRMDEYPLSMADRCLIGHLEELEQAGVDWAVIGGRGRRPEYSGFVTGLYVRALREQVLPTQEEQDRLAQALSPNGLSAGPLDPSGTAALLSPPVKPDRSAERLLSDVRKSYMSGELRRVPVSLYVVMRKGKNALFAAEDDQGHRAVFEGYEPIDLGRQGLSGSRVREVMYRSGGTPYSCSDVNCSIDPDLDYSDEALDDARKNLLSKITEARRQPKAVTVGDMPPAPEAAPVPERTNFIIQVTKEEQLTEALAKAEPDYLYVPAELLAAGAAGTAYFRDRGARIVAVLPRIVTDGEMPTLHELLAALRSVGVEEVLAGSLGLVPAALQAGMAPRGDFGLNVTNARAFARLTHAGFRSLTASFELSARQIWGLAAYGNAEMIVYGRAPVMVTERCLIRSSAGRCACSTPTSMGDPYGSVYPVEKEFGCRNVVYDGKKIFLADRPDIYGERGLWGVRLLFTTESARECVSVAERYRDRNRYQPINISRGAYPKGALWT
ncbi:MAG: DUF3656 domain-containing protein [Oscillospiraceae bacterium]|nr:DUF3656 domain-containing protein [Oscillospiraceae bacterium]